MFGSHLSIAGSLTNALREAESLKMDTVQIFTKNQQQWKAPPLAEVAISDWKREIDRLGWQGRTAAHASYLINLASPSDELWEKSIDLMRIEIERCEALGVPYLVHHPGSPGAEAGPEFGLDRIAAAYERLFRETAGFRTISCLENTVGAGSMLGARFEQLADLRSRIVDRTRDVGGEERVGYCFDTCHAHAAGYDLSQSESASRILDELDAHCGLARVHVLHLNDSKGQAGSHLDRHEHIGLGTIGRPILARSGFAAVVNRPEFADRPKILETPKGKNGSGIPYDTLNLRRLRKLAAGMKPIMSPIRRIEPKPKRPRSRQTTS